ncbi:cache domain-containing sensor histidine kinase [Butyrivibrio sp. XB500-5]|uniref:cache domain-containing sensor histidine kinase n=1 Tax=Butyrivibrio sp. XB500-5 TaxID=2364880 RepID=UPI001A9B05D5|nr:histidine kinase [Butyrivibrio sp. XB500-5]
MYSQRASVEKESVKSLESFEDSLEASIYNMGYQLDTLMSNSSFSLAFKTMLDYRGLSHSDLTTFNMLKYLFNSYESSYSYIHSVYMYLDGRERFLTSDTRQIANVDTYFDREWLDEYKSMAEDERVYTDHRWIQRHSYAEPVEVISIFYRMTYMDGVIVINIDKSEYGKLLRSVLISENQKVLLYNSKGDIICITDPELEDFEASVINEDIKKRIQGKETELGSKKWVKLDGKYYFADMLYSEYLNLYEVSVTSRAQLMEDLRIYIIMAVVILFVEIILMILLAYIYTKRNFSYIEECVDVFSAAERGEAVEERFRSADDEYSLIFNNVIRMHLNNSKMQMDLLEKQHEAQMAQMNALQLQINPHFIFNTLQTLDFEAIKKEGYDSEVHRMIQNLSMVVKYALSEPTRDVTIRMELEYLKAYLEIQNIRFGGNVITYFEVDETIYECKVFRLMLQPVLENCFEHGINNDEGKIHVKVKIFDRGDEITVFVVDNGRGITGDELKKLYEKINNKDSRNIGLTNLNRRLILRYGEDHALKIRSKAGFGTEVSFSVPKNDPIQ